MPSLSDILMPALGPQPSNSLDLNMAPLMDLILQAAAQSGGPPALGLPLEQSVAPPLAPAEYTKPSEEEEKKPAGSKGDTSYFRAVLAVAKALQGLFEADASAASTAAGSPAASGAAPAGGAKPIPMPNAALPPVPPLPPAGLGLPRMI